MRLKLQVPSDLDVKNVEYDAGKRELSMELIFYGAGHEALAGNVELEAFDTTILFKGPLKVSGLTGKPSVSSKLEPVLSAIEQKLKSGDADTAGKRGRKKKEGEVPSPAGELA